MLLPEDAYVVLGEIRLLHEPEPLQSCGLVGSHGLAWVPAAGLIVASWPRAVDESRVHVRASARLRGGGGGPYLAASVLRRHLCMAVALFAGVFESLWGSGRSGQRG